MSNSIQNQAQIQAQTSQAQAQAYAQQQNKSNVSSVGDGVAVAGDIAVESVGNLDGGRGGSENSGIEAGAGVQDQEAPTPGVEVDQETGDWIGELLEGGGEMVASAAEGAAEIATDLIGGIFSNLG